MNCVAQSVSAAAFAGVQGNTVDSLLAILAASASAAACRFPASSVPITFGCRNGKALLLRSSDSPGTSATPSVVSPRRSRAVFRYSREVGRRNGGGRAAFKPAPPVDAPVPPVPADPPGAILPLQPSERSIIHATAPTVRRQDANRTLGTFDASLMRRTSRRRDWRFPFIGSGFHRERRRAKTLRFCAPSE